MHNIAFTICEYLSYAKNIFTQMFFLVAALAWLAV